MRSQKGFAEEALIGAIAAFFVGLLVVLIIMMIVGSIKEQKQWQAFAAAHSCKLVATKQGTVSSGVGTAVGANGQVSVVPITTTTPGQEAFLCDDGVTYWRNK